MVQRRASCERLRKARDPCPKQGVILNYFLLPTNVIRTIKKAKCTRSR